MHIKRGTYRTVVLLPSLGVVIKFPNIFVRRVVKYLWQNRDPRKRSTGYDWFLHGEITSWGNLRNSLFAGIVQNQAEYRFYRTMGSVFAWPTLFSLWGLLNVQPFGQELAGEHEASVWSRVYHIAKDRVTDMHCFAEARNYCHGKDGALYLLDYASENSQEVLTHYGEDLRSAFLEGP